MHWLGYVGLFAVLGLVVVHRIVARRWLQEYVATYGKLPGWGWLTETDENAAVERWRRRRLAVLIPLLVLFVVEMVWLLAPR